MTDLNALLERVKAATGPDRELDADIAQAVDGVEIQWRQANGTMEMYPVQRYPSTAHAAGFGIGPVPILSASIDAAMAFTERVLPGWGVETVKPAGDGNRSCRIYPGSSFEANAKQTAFGSGATIPLAILDATLTALIATPAGRTAIQGETK